MLDKRFVESQDSPKVDHRDLEEVVSKIFVAAGCNTLEASQIAMRLVDSNCTGHDSHGVVRVTRYLKWVREQKLIPNQTPEVLFETESIIAVDGRRGFGQTVAPFALRRGIAKAIDQGVALVGLRRSGHLGRIGDWAAMAADQGLCSIHFVNVNGHVLVAPFGGTDRRMSTAPIAIGIPRSGEFPVILDFATSLVAEGKALVSLKGGKEIRSDALIGPSGTHTGDPKTLYGVTPYGEPPNPKNGPGAIRAFGDHKGSGLAFMCEALAGIFTGSGSTGSKNVPDHQLWSGMVSILFRADTFIPFSMFSAELAQFVDFYTGSPRADADVEIKIPGAVENENRIRAHKSGLRVPDEILADINAAAASLGITERI